MTLCISRWKAPSIQKKGPLTSCRSGPNMMSVLHPTVPTNLNSMNQAVKSHLFNKSGKNFNHPHSRIVNLNFSGCLQKWHVLHKTKGEKYWATTFCNKTVVSLNNLSRRRKLYGFTNQVKLKTNKGTRAIFTDIKCTKIFVSHKQILNFHCFHVKHISTFGLSPAKGLNTYPHFHQSCDIDRMLIIHLC